MDNLCIHIHMRAQCTRPHLMHPTCLHMPAPLRTSTSPCLSPARPLHAPTPAPAPAYPYTPERYDRFVCHGFCIKIFRRLIFYVFPLLFTPRAVRCQPEPGQRKGHYYRLIAIINNSYHCRLIAIIDNSYY